MYALYTYKHISISSGRVSVKHHKSSIEVAIWSVVNVFTIYLLKNVYSFTLRKTGYILNIGRRCVKCEERLKAKNDKNHSRLRGLEIIDTLFSLIYRHIGIQSNERSIHLVYGQVIQPNKMLTIKNVYFRYTYI